MIFLKVWSSDYLDRTYQELVKHSDSDCFLSLLKQNLVCVWGGWGVMGLKSSFQQKSH